MSGGQDSHQPFGPEGGDLHGGVHRSAGAQQGEVVGALEQAFDQFRIEQLTAEFQGHPGQLCPDRTGDPRKDVVRGGSDEPDGHAADPPGGEQCHLILRPLHLGQDRPRVRHQMVARLSELHPPCGPGEERRPELSLQLLELLGERRLGHVQALGGTAEVAFLDESEEVTDMPEFHDHILSRRLINQAELNIGRDQSRNLR